MNTYEAMFLFDTSRAGDTPAMEAEVSRLMQRIEAELLVCKKWDERKLAYPIQGRKRGCYALTYFKSAPDRIADLERDGQLSEAVLRMLVLRADGITPEQMQAPTPVEAAAAERDANRRRLEQEASARAERAEQEAKKEEGSDETAAEGTEVNEPADTTS